MTAPGHSRATAFLRRTGLLAGVLAIIAGILGMHIMTSTHTMHAPTALTGSAGGTVHAQPAAADGHAGHPAVRRTTEVRDKGAASAESCSCPGTCSMQAMSVSCVPSAKSGSLAAPLPGTRGVAVNVNAGVTDAATGHWSYLPGSPSPGELSISRT